MSRWISCPRCSGRSSARATAYPPPSSARRFQSRSRAPTWWPWPGRAPVRPPRSSSRCCTNSVSTRSRLARARWSSPRPASSRCRPSSSRRSSPSLPISDACASWEATPWRRSSTISRRTPTSSSPRPVAYCTTSMRSAGSPFAPCRTWCWTRRTGSSRWASPTSSGTS